MEESAPNVNYNSWSFIEKGICDADHLEKNISETQIWKEFINGSDSAVSYLYRSYVDALYTYGRQFADNSLVLDSIQDIYFDLIKSRKRLSEVKSVKAYLYASLRRKILKTKSKKLKMPEYNFEENGFRISTATDGVTPLDQFTKGKIEILSNACNALPIRQREAILLRYYEQLPYEEIAVIMGIGKSSSVRMLVSRAISSLKILLESHRDELMVGLVFYSLCKEITPAGKVI